MRMTMLLSDAAVHHADERVNGQVDPQVGSVLTIRPSHHRTQQTSQRRPAGDREVLSTSRGSFHMRDHIRRHRADDLDHGGPGRTGQVQRIGSAAERFSANDQRTKGGEIRRSESFWSTTNHAEPFDHGLHHQQTDDVTFEPENIKRVWEWLATSINDDDSRPVHLTDHREETVNAADLSRPRKHLAEHNGVVPVRRRLPDNVQNAAAPHLDKSRDFMSSTSTLQRPPSSTCSSQSTEIAGASDTGSDSTDFTPWEFHAHSLPQRPTSRPTGARHTAGGPYVARISVSTINHQRSDGLAAGRQCDAAGYGNANKQPTRTAENYRTSTSPAADLEVRNGTVDLLEPIAAVVRARENRRIATNGCSSTSPPVEERMNHEETVEFSSKSPLKHPPTKHPLTAAGDNRCSVSDESDDVSRQVTASLVAENDSSRWQKNDEEVPVKHRRKLTNGFASKSIDADRPRHVSEMDSSNIVPSSRRLPTTVVGCAVTSSAVHGRRDSESADFGAYVAADRDRRRNERDRMSKNGSEGRRRSLPRIHRDIHRRASTENAITRDVAFGRNCGPDAAPNTSNHFVLGSPAANSAEVAQQDSVRSERTKSRRVVGATLSRPSPDEDRRHEAKLDQMKLYCLEQLALPSKSMTEVTRRRRGKQQRKMAPEVPDSVHTSKSGAILNAAVVSPRKYGYSVARRGSKCSLMSSSENRDNEVFSNGVRAAGHEYSSPHQYTSLDRRVLRHSSLVNDAEDASENPLKIFITERPTSSNVNGNVYASHTVDRSNGRIRARTSTEGDAVSCVANDHSPVSNGVQTLSRAGRLSVTISNNNSPEPEIHRKLSTISSSGTDRRGQTGSSYSSSQMYAALADRDVINRKYQRRRDSSPSVDSDDGNKSSSSDVTISGDYEEGETDEEIVGDRSKQSVRHSAERTSTMSSSGPRGVDAAVQVELEHGTTSDPHFSEVERARRSAVTATSDAGQVRIHSAYSEQTATVQRLSPDFESTASTEYFRRSGKDVWRASMELHRKSDGKPSAKIDGRNHGTQSERSVAKKAGRRKRQHRPADQEEHLNSASQMWRDKVERTVSQQTSGTRWQNDREGNDMDLRMTNEDEPKPAELHDEVFENGHQECLENVEVQTSTMSFQLPSTSSDSSVVDEAADDGFPQSKVAGGFVNRKVANEAPETLEKQSASVVVVNDRSRKISQNGPGKIAAEDTAEITMKDAFESQTSKLPQETTRSPAVPYTYSHSSALEGSMVGVLVNGECLAKETSAADALGTTGQWNSSDTTELPDHLHRNPVQTRPTPKESITNNHLVNGWQSDRVKEKFRQEASAIWTHAAGNRREIYPGTQATRTSNGTSPRSNPALRHQLPPRPEKASFISRLFNRLTS